MNEVTKEIDRGSQDFFPLKPMDYHRFLVLSLGTGSPRAEMRYTAAEAATWGVVGWLTKSGAYPLIDIFMRGSTDMIDYHLAAIFQALRSEENYIRIQDDSLNPELATVEGATKENLKGLVEVGEALLEKKVTKVNTSTGQFEPISEHTNKDILKNLTSNILLCFDKLAKLLVDEKRIRDVRSPHGKRLGLCTKIAE
ncbi:Patatin-like protein [Drosera capensis]